MNPNDEFGTPEEWDYAADDVARLNPKFAGMWYSNNSAAMDLIKARVQANRENPPRRKGVRKTRGVISPVQFMEGGENA